MSVLVEITEENGNTHQGRAIFTCIDSTLDEPIVYRMEGITELEPVKTQPIPEVPEFQMKDLHGNKSHFTTVLILLLQAIIQLRHLSL